MKHTDYKSLKPYQKKVLDKAADAMENAYSPYSRFCVGAALFTSGGKIITGANFENAAYGPTICAERSAVARANAMGMRVFKGIAVIAKGNDFDTKEITSPCGICRQVLFEIASLAKTGFEVIMSNTKKDRIIVADIKELLPLGFGPLDIGIDISQYMK